MTRTILTYGLISGAIIVVAILLTSGLTGNQHNSFSVYLGYLIMLVALSSILVGVKQHRDQTLGGAIRFWPAFGVGLGIAVVASLSYVVIWECYLAITHYTFMDKYTASMLAAKRAAGVTGAAYAKAVAAADQMRRDYANPVYRVGETFMEIFPVGLFIALITAALVRNPRFLPARSRPMGA
jgi:hypothetical protein